MLLPKLLRKTLFGKNNVSYTVEVLYLRMMISRRRFLSGLVGVVASAALPTSLFALTEQRNQFQLALRNTHTNEEFYSSYRTLTDYDTDAVKKLSWLLRDFRSEKAVIMHPRLFDILYAVSAHLNYSGKIEIVSGYRTKITNDFLRRSSALVAKDSYHTHARALDFFLPGISLSKLHDVCLKLQAGGVGYYRSSGFIHIDLGPVRRWSA